MTHTPLPDQVNNLNQSVAEVINTFNKIANTIETTLGSPPINYYTTIKFEPVPFKLTGPRFGVTETKIDSKQYALEISQDILTKYSKYLDPILWREAYLLHLPHNIRQVPQAADLGLYYYYCHALINKKQRNQFLNIWQTVSPPIDYAFYRYYPTLGFDYFDNLVDGEFHKMVKDWFKPFTQLSTPMNTENYTANLERWMFNHHQVLRPIELKILRGLNDCLTCSQIELAEKLNLRQPTISQAIRKLAEKHLLRLVVFENYPNFGLQPVTVKFTISHMVTKNYLLKLISGIRYALSIQEFDTMLLASFLIPTERITRFRQWIKQIASYYDLILPELRMISERLDASNFEMYYPHMGGWQIEVESLLDNFLRLLAEEWTPHLPLVNSFKISSTSLKKKIRIMQEDFIYIQRASDAFLATEQMKFYESHELRKAGYKESEHMAYRRRVKFLENHQAISPPIGLGLLNIGLNSVIHLYLEEPLEETLRIFKACQLFPKIAAKVYEDGTGTATILVPSEIAVNFKKSITEVLLNLDIIPVTSIRPAWKAYGWTGPPIFNSVNYNFDRCKWIWTKDTLPTPRT
ncbi:MAG: hypothetical protein ACXADB_01380 [Candidatus Hermodarchaeia archaeon]|jgi:DNA-binding Lrp family transcriptional regulator